MTTIPELQDLLDSKKAVLALLNEKIIANQAIKDQYVPKLKYAQELGQDVGPIILKLQSLNYTDPVILQNGVDKVNQLISNIVSQIDNLTSVNFSSSRLGNDGTPSADLVAADDIPEYLYNNDAALAINNEDIKQDSGNVPQTTNDWPTEGWA